MGGASGMAGVMQELVKKAQLEQIKKAADEQKALLLELTTHSYSQAQAYTNLVIGAGYVAFFSIWAAVYKDMDAFYKVWSIIGFIISALVFVFWEVGKMIFTASFLQKQEGLTRINDAAKFNEAMVQYKEQTQIGLATQTRVWIYVLMATIIPAFVGCGFLLYGILSINYFG